MPNAGAAVEPVPGTRSELTPVSRHYRIDINTSPPSIPETSWRLRIHGLVAMPLEWTLADLRSRQATHQFITLSCISNTVGGDLHGDFSEEPEKLSLNLHGDLCMALRG